MTKWVHRYHMIVAAKDQEAANQEMVKLTGNQADLLTFTVPLSPKGKQPATHYGCSTAATAKYLQAIEISPAVELLFCRIKPDDCSLESSNFPEGKASWAEMLKASGLQEVEGLTEIAIEGEIIR